MEGPGQQEWSLAAGLKQEFGSEWHRGARHSLSWWEVPAEGCGQWRQQHYQDKADHAHHHLLRPFLFSVPQPDVDISLLGKMTDIIHKQAASQAFHIPSQTLHNMGWEMESWMCQWYANPPSQHLCYKPRFQTLSWVCALLNKTFWPFSLYWGGWGGRSESLKFLKTPTVELF